MSIAGSTTAGPPGPRPSQRRTRALALALALAGLSVLGLAVWRPPPADAGPPAVRAAGLFVLSAFGFLLLGALLRRLQLAWHRHLRGALVGAGEALWRLSGRLWPRQPAAPDRSPPMRLGERIALVAGLGLTALDVVLTTLLLRDVFPEPPYRFDLFGLLSPTAAEWSFYVAVAAFKAVLEVWFGVFDTIRGGGGTLRWFVLGGASAFDAALAASRGLVLAEQGLGGAAVMVSNIIFIGFGLAVPWVAAHTGGLLVGAMDGWLARLGVLRLISALPRLAVLGLVWLLAIALGAPLLTLVLGLGLLVAVWSALDDVVATVLGHDDGASGLALPHEVLRAADEPPASPRSPLEMRAGGVP
jgi:hypothetical protein